jgi:hypothetical protein
MFSPSPKTRSLPDPAVSSNDGNVNTSRGPYTWWGATATVSRSPSATPHASRTAFSPNALVSAYGCKNTGAKSPPLISNSWSSRKPATFGSGYGNRVLGLELMTMRLMLWAAHTFKTLSVPS